MLNPWREVRELEIHLAGMRNDRDRAQREADRWMERAQAEQRITAHAEGRAAALADHVRELSDTIVKMKREGFELPAAEPEAGEPEPVDSGLPPKVRSAIRSVADPGSPLYDDLTAFALDLLEQGLEAGAVAKRLRTGSNVNPFQD